MKYVSGFVTGVLTLYSVIVTGLLYRRAEEHFNDENKEEEET